MPVVPEVAPIPPGFRLIERLSPFNALVGPLYEKREGETVSIGLAIDQKHTNSRGVCHGGVLATLADLALGYAMLARSGDKGSFVTAHLAVDYAGAARKGDWVESSVEIQRVGARLAFANCYLVAGGRPIVRASAIFARDGKSP
jgi:acyl-coenzyme A thioesterase 13